MPRAPFRDDDARLLRRRAPWSHPHPPFSRSPSGGGAITTSGAIDEDLGLVFAGTSDTDVFAAVALASGATAWKADAGGALWGTLGPAEGLDASTVCVGAGGDANYLKAGGGDREGD